MHCSCTVAKAISSNNFLAIKPPTTTPSPSCLPQSRWVSWNFGMFRTTYCTRENRYVNDQVVCGCLQKPIESSDFIRSFQSMQTLLECFNPNDLPDVQPRCLPNSYSEVLHRSPRRATAPATRLAGHDMAHRCGDWWIDANCNSQRSSKLAALRIRCFKGKKGFCPKLRASVSKQNSPAAICNPLAAWCNCPALENETWDLWWSHLSWPVSLLKSTKKPGPIYAVRMCCLNFEDVWSPLKTQDYLDDMQVTREHQTFRTV